MLVNKREALLLCLGYELRNVSVVETAHVDKATLFHAWHVIFKVVKQNAQIDVGNDKVERALVSQ